MKKSLLLLLSLVAGLGSINAQDFNSKAHEKCKARKGDDYNFCYLYYSRMYPKIDTKILVENDSNETLINELRNHGIPEVNKADKEFLRLHLKLMHAFWSEHANNRGLNLPPPTLRLDDGYLRGCGGKRISKLPNIYCPESSEITLDVRPLISGLTDRRSLNISYLSLAILSHEFGHHVNHHIGREKYLDNEENEADWKAGKYFSYVIYKQLIPLEGFTKGANMFFSVGDFHLLSKHDNPKNRFHAFMNGFNDESMGVGRFAGEWLQDTRETFSRVVKNPDYKHHISFDVYRFEIERGRQIAGNLFAGVLGAINCSQGSNEDCVNSLLLQGQSKPEGWFRARRLIIDCKRRTFDIKGDGFKTQFITSDRKGQAQYLFKRHC